MWLLLIYIVVSMRRIDTKYRIDGTIIKNDGTPIPDDEPLFLFRAQDKLLPEVLSFYKKLRIKHGASEETIKKMDEQTKRIIEWQKNHYTKLPL